MADCNACDGRGTRGPGYVCTSCNGTGMGGNPGLGCLLIMAIYGVALLIVAYPCLKR